MLEIAHEIIDVEGMMPEEYKNRDIPVFSLRLNVPRLPEKKSAGHMTISVSKGRRLSI